MSLNKVYEVGLKHALENIQRNGGKLMGENILIKLQEPIPVRLEQSFTGVYPVNKIPVHRNQAGDEISFEFEGTGFVLRGETSNGDSHSDYVFETALYVDGKKIESPALPANFTTRRHELCWNYDLPKAKHSVVLKILNPSKEIKVQSTDAIIYSDKPVDGIKFNLQNAKDQIGL
jgi:hypothetical protein